MAYEVERHESPEVRTGRILALVGGFILFTAVLFGGLELYYRSMLRPTALVQAPRQFPAPQLQPNPTQDYADFKAVQIRQLSGYAWVDRDKGLIHVPIERAMALVAGRGTQAYDPVDGSAAAAGGMTPVAPLDGAPRDVPSPGVAPYGEVR